MSGRWDVEAPRLAALARLELSQEERGRLAQACEAITAEFSQLAAYAADLPPAPPDAPGALRDDEPAPASADEVGRILAAAPRVDPATREVLAPRGLP